MERVEAEIGPRRHQLRVPLTLTRDHTSEMLATKSTLVLDLTLAGTTTLAWKLSMAAFMEMRKRVSLITTVMGSHFTMALFRH